MFKVETGRLKNMYRSVKLGLRRWLFAGAAFIAFACLSSTAVYASRLITTPFAETLPAGKVSVWQFALHENRSTNEWRTLNRLDIGLTGKLELGLFVINPPNKSTDTWINLQYRINKETDKAPVLSVGVWDAAHIDKFSGQKIGGSFFLTAGKTIKPKFGDWSPQYIKLSLGTGTNRLNGMFGGVDMRITPKTGVFVEYAPINLRLPNTEAIDAGVYYWFSPNWRTRASWVGGNPMADVFYTWTIGK